MQGFVYMHRYHQLSNPNTKIANVKHLEYIATRPGAIFNPGCSFGLFGKLPEVLNPECINSLDYAKKVISAISKRRTVYRAVLSLDHETAIAKDFYRRETWESFFKSHADIIAANMDIEIQHFSYMSSMHYKKGHPHLHIAFWDDSGQIRNEYIPEKRFEIMMEHIRGEFSKIIFKDEIAQIRSEQRGFAKTTRQTMLAMMRELNPKDILDIGRINENVIVQELGKVLEQLCLDKNRRYAYLKSETKEVFKSFTDTLFQQPQFKGLKLCYTSAAAGVNRYYANTGDGGEYYKEKALEELYKEIGNGLLSFVKEQDLVLGYRALIAPDTQRLLCSIKREIYANNDLSKAYQHLLSHFPSHRTPLSEIANADFYKELHSLAVSVATSDKLKYMVRLYVEHNASLPKPTEGESDLSFMRTPTKEMLSKNYGKLYANVRSMIMDSIYSDVGYHIQWMQAMTTNIIIELFGGVSQSKNHMQHKAAHMQKNGELSKSALKDLRAKLRTAQQTHEL